jgi:two-component system response regulator RegX3
MRIVVVDPDDVMKQLLQFVLRDAGHDVELTSNAQEAVRAVIGRETDAVVLEADLPGIDGLETCKELRARRYNGPILFLTERASMSDKLRAFAYGADDYIVEPFHVSELLVRIDSAVRRFRQSHYQSLGTVLKVGNAELTTGELKFQIRGRPAVILTPTEMRLLQCLMRNSQIMISRETLIEQTWGYDFLGDTNRVDVYIRRLRKKIERDVKQPEYIHTVRGIGYVFRAPAETDGIDIPASELVTNKTWSNGSSRESTRSYATIAANDYAVYVDG